MARNLLWNAGEGFFFNQWQQCVVEETQISGVHLMSMWVMSEFTFLIALLMNGSRDVMPVLKSFPHLAWIMVAQG
jgi:hypothetical protein